MLRLSPKSLMMRGPLHAAVPENCPATGCAYVLDPVRVISEHRYQSAIAQLDAENRYRLRAARGQPEASLALLDKLDRSLRRRAHTLGWHPTGEHLADGDKIIELRHANGGNR